MAEDREPEWKRKQRLAEIFGDVLPTVTSDEKEAAPEKDGADTASERWLKAQVPPHHGG